jgi:hypothetical protein
MWGTRGTFPPAAAMVVAVVTPVVFCAKATEKRKKTLKLVGGYQKSLFITIYCKIYCNSYIPNCALGLLADLKETREVLHKRVLS